jgi:WD40 repeat protein
MIIKMEFIGVLYYKEKEELIKLIENCKDGNIRIWNFHTGLLMKKIKVNNILKDACLWNNTYLFVGCGNSIITLLSLKKGIIIP